MAFMWTPPTALRRRGRTRAHKGAAMCGICGYISDNSISDEQLRQMNDTMYHRGPNDCGIWQESPEYGAVGLAQRRLSIFDLSPLGHQPMVSHHGQVITVYNGEIYNFQELRTELELAGHVFRSSCDTEVMLAAYETWGCDCFERFNGMFAIALYDREQGRLVLARDRMGKKPLYYYHNGNDFVFASELKPIMKFPRFVRRIEKTMIEKFLCNKYIEAPYSIFQNTYKVIPGTYVVYRPGKTETATVTYWDIVEKKAWGDAHPAGSMDAAVEQLDALLHDSVRSRLEADVPVGTFLSGGIDSTLVTAVAQNVCGEQVKSFSIGFYDKERDEAQYAAAIAGEIGTQHRELYIGEPEILEMLKDLPYYYDEPFSDSSQLPTMLVSKMASEEITVALSGDGGDELYCGYKMYDWTRIAQRADWMGRTASCIPGMGMLKKSFPAELRAFVNNRDDNYKTQLFIEVMIEEADRLLGMRGTSVKFEQERRLNYEDWQERRMMLDMMTYLPDEVLAKTDRASMKYSLEVRCPLLDYRIVEHSFTIPHEYKYAKGDKKHILKALTYRYVPKQLLDRPKKGFGVPLKRWLRTVLKPELLKYADKEILRRQDIFVPEAVERLIRMQEKSDRIVYSSMLWSFYVFQRWYQKYLEDLWGGA